MSSALTMPLVNKPADTVVWRADACCCLCSPSMQSPIDEYYAVATDLVLRAGQQESDDQVRRLLLVDLVSAVELYFRRILSELTALCPLARETANGRTLTLGAARYYPSDAVARALLEHASLASDQEIRSQVRNLLNLEVKPTSSEGAALLAFDRVCQLRHAVVHARGELGASNAATLLRGPVPTGRLMVKVDAIAFQALVTQAHNAVRAMNQFLFECTIKRWWKEGVLRGRWEEDKSLFDPLVRLCASAMDNGAVDGRKMHSELLAAGLE